MTTIFVFLIKAYQLFLSPDRGVIFQNHVRTCRFFPSCSEYTIGVLQKYGFIRGICYGLWRVGRCHPWVAGGYDPIEDKS